MQKTGQIYEELMEVSGSMRLQSCEASLIKKIFGESRCKTLCGGTQRVPVIDMHCDTAGLIYSRNLQAEAKGKKKSGADGYSFSITPEEMENGISFRRNTRHIDFERMKKGGYMCQCFAHYVSRKLCEQAEQRPFEILTAMLQNTDRAFAENSDLIRPVLTGSEIEKNSAKMPFVYIRRFLDNGKRQGKANRVALHIIPV